jgi:bacterioferritin
MKDQKQTIEYLQEILSGIMAGAQQHFMHATINKQRGFHKLGDHMLEENASEMAESASFVNRIIELGGVPSIKPEKFEIQMEIESQLKVEYQEQLAAMEFLNTIIDSIQKDQLTLDLIQKYTIDEAAHTNWLKQQLDLIAAIGLQNYLASQV